MFRTAAFLLTIASPLVLRAADTPAPPSAGATVGNFSLNDIHRRPRSLESYKSKTAIVVVFVGTECPLANLYFPTLVELHREYADKGVQFLAINSNPQDTFTLVSAHAQERDLPFPVLKDFDQTVAAAFGAKRTPEAFLLDDKRVIRYRGRIDDQYGIGYRRAAPTRRDLQDAIDELLAAKPITVAQTEPSGCLIDFTKPAPDNVDNNEVTYAKHASRIFQDRCQMCHRPNEVAPFSLLTYKDAKDWSATIEEVLVEQRMPPWHADPRHGRFLNRRTITDDERDTLLAWIRQGCPPGDDADLPPPAVFSTDWSIGTPDKVYRMAEEYQVPATGVVPYQRFTVDPGFAEDVWVQAAETRPGNRAVVHHILIYFQSPDQPLFAADGATTTLVGWAPGDMPAIYRPGMAKRIPAGSKLIFEVHYTPNGTAQSDRSSVAVIFAKEPPKHPVETNILANLRFRIPPGAPNHRGQMTYSFRDDALLLSFMPHMHLRGTSAKYEATYPDGRTETLLSVPDYDFNWQTVYRFAEPLQIPKGTKLTWTGHWDNSADNPRNPDATKEITWGYQTWDEMQNGWMEVVWPRESK